MIAKQIIIKAIESNEKEYLAYYKDEFMQASFCVAFKDTILGAVALTRFIEMIKSSFEIKRIPISVSEIKFEVKSKALLDVFKNGKEDENEYL